MFDTLTINIKQAQAKRRRLAQNDRIRSRGRLDPVSFGFVMVHFPFACLVFDYYYLHAHSSPEELVILNYQCPVVTGKLDR